MNLNIAYKQLHYKKIGTAWLNKFLIYRGKMQSPPARKAVEGLRSSAVT